MPVVDISSKWHGEQRNLQVLYRSLVTLLLLLLAFHSSYSYAGSPGHVTMPTVFPVNGPTIACTASSSVNCPTKKSTYYEITTPGIESMYEQSVEEPCFVNGQTMPCSSNNYFNPQIRMNIRYCLGVPVPLPVTSSCWKNFGAKFFSGSHDCWKLACAGAQMSGSKNLGFGECSFIQGVRFCARFANPGTNSESYGNRTSIDTDYRAVGAGSPYPSDSSDEASYFTLTNGETLQLVNTTTTMKVPYDSSKSVKVGTTKVVSYTGNMSDLDAGVVYVIPEDAVLVAGRTVDSSQAIYLKKSGSDYVVVTPRMQLCAFEDPMDFNDTSSSFQPLHLMTPSIDFKDNPLTGYAKMMGIGAGVIYLVALPFAPILVTGLITAAAVMLIMAAIQMYINYIVIQNEGCIDMALAPSPPPYPTTITNPIPAASAQAICNSKQTETTADCVNSKTSGKYDTFTQPIVRVGFNSVIPTCSAGQTSTSAMPCVIVSGGTVTSANKEDIKDQIDNMTDLVSGESLPRPDDIRPYYTLTSTDPITYTVTGVMTGDYGDLSFTFAQDATSKDYPGGTNSTVTLKDPRSGTTAGTYPSRKFFNCLGDEGASMCVYELLKTPQDKTSTTATPYPCQYINDTAYVKPVSCISRQPMIAPVITKKQVKNPNYGILAGVAEKLTVSFDTCANNTAMTAQSPNCSAHTQPLLKATIAEGTLTETVIFGGKSEEHIAAIVTAKGAINPIKNNPLTNETTGTRYPDGGYAACRYMFGVKFCTEEYSSVGQADPVQYYMDGDEYVVDSAGNPVYKSGIVSDGTGYLYGAGELCLGGYTKSDTKVLSAKVSGKGYLNDISTAPEDVLVQNYVQGQVITYSTTSTHYPRVPAPDPYYPDDRTKDDKTNTIINNDTEGLREITAAELGMCVDVPPPLPCPAIQFNDDPATNWKSTTDTTNNGNATWAATTPAIISTSSGATTVTTVPGTCRRGWYGSPTRTCTVTQGPTAAESTAVWGAVSGKCTLQGKCKGGDGDDSIRDGGHTYDCDWSDTSVYYLDKDSCDYKSGADVRHRNRALCCAADYPTKTTGKWIGTSGKNEAYPDSNTPPADCNWTEKGKQPYLLQ